MTGRLLSFATFAICASAALLAFGEPAVAVTSYPMIMGLSPVAVQAGTSAVITVQSRYSMDGSYRVVISGAGVTGEIDDPHSKPIEFAKKPAKNGKPRPTLESLKVRFHAAKDALPGIRDVRLAGPYGASTVGQLVVVSDPVITEKRDNDTPEKAQPITLPAAVCGTIESAEDRDYFKFHVEAGRSLVFHVRGMQLENRIHDLQFHLDPIITLRGPGGSTLAVCDNDVSGDPTLCHRFDRAGDYTLEIRDVRYKGDRDWVYCVEINDRPLVRTVFPSGLRAGERVTLEPMGDQIPKAAAIDWVVPSAWGLGYHDTQFPLAGGLTNPVSVVLTDLPTVSESSSRGGNDTVRTAQSVPVPVGINGRIEKEQDADFYAFRAKKGEALTMEVVSRRTGSPLDSILRIRDAKGRLLREGDDLSDFRQTSADSIIEDWTAPADGTYAVEIRDLLQRGGPTFVYFLTITRALPAFELDLDTDKTQLAPGTAGVIYVNCLRKHGFTEEVALSIEGLPAGVTAQCGTIPPGHRDGCIILTAAPGAKATLANVVISGTAKHVARGGTPAQLHAIARPWQEIYLPGGGRGHWPVESHAVAVGTRADLLGVNLGKHEVSLKPGESVRIDVTIVRAAGFSDNVTLSARFDHLGRVFGDTLPKGITVDGTHSKTVLIGNESRGFVTLRAAPNVEPMDHALVAVMANVSINFVMKATYSSQPLFVTTLPPGTALTKK